MDVSSLAPCSAVTDEQVFSAITTSEICRNADVLTGNNTLSIQCSTSVRPDCLYLRSNQIVGKGSIPVGGALPLDSQCQYSNRNCKLTVEPYRSYSRVTLTCSTKPLYNCIRDMVHFEEEMTSSTSKNKTCSFAKFGIVLDSGWMAGSCSNDLKIRIDYNSPLTTTASHSSTHSHSTSTPNTSSSNSPPRSSTPTNPEGTGSLAGIVVGSLLGCILVVAIIALVVFWFRRKRMPKQNTNDRKPEEANREYEGLKVDEKADNNHYKSLNVSISNVCLDNNPRENSSMTNFYAVVDGENTYVNDVTAGDYVEPAKNTDAKPCDDQNVYLEIVDKPDDKTTYKNLQDLTEEDDDYIVPDDGRHTSGDMSGEQKDPEDEKRVISQKL